MASANISHVAGYVRAVCLQRRRREDTSRYSVPGWRVSLLSMHVKANESCNLSQRIRSPQINSLEEALETLSLPSAHQRLLLMEVKSALMAPVVRSRSWAKTVCLH